MFSYINLIAEFHQLDTLIDVVMIQVQRFLSKTVER